ncbi:MAG: DNRLRE domain-containing protein [Bacteroidales bacterium]|nr:DNRLRE domain-containing protein [Bacteroidales bacterium]
MKKSMFLLIALFGCAISYAQTTVILKPNAVIGKDVAIMNYDNGCIATIDSISPADMNFANDTVLWMKDWTYIAIGCSGGTVRSLLCFTGLDSIPQNATILSATLRLYGTNADRNTSYPGAPSGFYANTVVVQQVIYPWDENTVTWNTQPTTTTVNQFTLPQSTSEYNWNCSVSNSNLVAMVQSMVSGNNYGFLFKLQNEAHYRNLAFSSSDCSDSTLWPELEVTYDYCEARFSMTMENSDHPNTITFSAYEQGGQHSWRYGTQILSTQPTFTITLGQTQSDGLCHSIINDGDTCETCIKLCMGDIPRMIDESKSLEESIVVPQGYVPLGDEVVFFEEKEVLKVIPNPTNGKWKIDFVAEESCLSVLTLYDSNGNIVFSKDIQVKVGENSMDLSCDDCENGIYTIVIKGEKLNLSQKVNIVKSI